METEVRITVVRHKTPGAQKLGEVSDIGTEEAASFSHTFINALPGLPPEGIVRDLVKTLEELDKFQVPFG